MAEIPREVKIRIKADTAQFEAGMKRARITASRLSWQFGGGPPRWRPWSWYATSERTPR